MHFGRLGRGELVAAVGGLLLAVCLFLPWYETDPDNPNAVIDGQRGALSGWEVHPIMRWLLLAAAAAPFILIWIVIRDHELSWARGEMTAVAAIAAFGLVAYAGFLDRPGRAGRRDLPAARVLRRAAGHDPDDRRRGNGRRRDRTRTQTPGGAVDDRACRPQPRARARARDRGRGAGGGAARRHGRQGGGRPGGRRRHARGAAHDAHGRDRGDRRGGEGRGADARTTASWSATARRRRSTSRSIRSRARGWPRQGRPNALAVIALSERGTMFDPGPVRLHGEDGRHASEIADLLDLDRPLGETARPDRRAQGHRRARRDGRRARPPAPRGRHPADPRGGRARAADHGRRRLRRAARGLARPAGRPAVGHRRHARGRDLGRRAQVLRRRADRAARAARRRRAPGGGRRRLRRRPRAHPGRPRARATTASSRPPA